MPGTSFNGSVSPAASSSSPADAALQIVLKNWAGGLSASANDVAALSLGNGRLRTAADTATQIVVGRISEADTYAANAEVTVEADPIELDVTSVTDLDNDNDVGKPVFALTGNTRTLIPPTDDRKVSGFITEYGGSAGAGKMFHFGMQTAYVYNMAGLHTEVIEIVAKVGWNGYIYGGGSFGRRLCGHGKIISIAAIGMDPPPSAEGSTNPTVTPVINGVACNAGVTITGANLDAYGQYSTPVSITSGNTFSDGDYLALSSDAAFTGNFLYSFIIEIQRGR